MLEQWSSSIDGVKCYDPNEGMLKAFRKAIHDPRVTAEEGTFSSTTVQDGWADFIGVATVSSQKAREVGVKCWTLVTESRNIYVGVPLVSRSGGGHERIR